jgi:hypothetical protein
MKSAKLVLMFGLVIGFCGAFASSAKAQCGPQLKNKQPALAFSIQAKEDRATEQKESIESAADAPSIVGLWDVQFLVDGQVVDEGFDQYHSDGTEVLNDTPPPAAGSVCLGVYVKTGKRSIKLKHPSWIYDATNTTVIGRATILEDITLDPGGNSFTGTFILQLRDLMGNPLAPDAPGQLKGDRIVPD